MKNWIRPLLRFRWLCLVCLWASTAPAFAQALICTNPIGQPTHTASFNYQIGTGTAYMRFGDGQAAALTGSSGTITHAYNKTGIYYAELLKDNVPVDTFAVTVKTGGWISKVGTYWCNPFFNDVAQCDAVTGNGIFHIPVNPGAAVCSEYASFTERLQNFGVPGDNCSFEIRAKDPISEGGCPGWKDVVVQIFGKKIQLIFRYWMGIRIGQVLRLVEQKVLVVHILNFQEI